LSGDRAPEVRPQAGREVFEFGVCLLAPRGEADREQCAIRAGNQVDGTTRTPDLHEPRVPPDVGLDARDARVQRQHRRPGRGVLQSDGGDDLDILTLARIQERRTESEAEEVVLVNVHVCSVHEACAHDPPRR